MDTSFAFHFEESYISPAVALTPSETPSGIEEKETSSMLMPSEEGGSFEENYGDCDILGSVVSEKQTLSVRNREKSMVDSLYSSVFR